MEKLISINLRPDRWSISVSGLEDSDYMDVFYSENNRAYTVVIHSATIDKVPELIEQAKPKLERLKKKGPFGRTGRDDNA